MFGFFEKTCEIFRTSSEINCLSASFRRSVVIAPILVVLPSTDSCKCTIRIVTVNICQDRASWNELAFAFNAIKTQSHNEAIQ